MFKKLLFLINFLVFSSLGYGFYISLDQEGRNYSSDSIQRHSAASFAPLYAKLMEVPDYREKVEFLRQLPSSFEGTLIDSLHAVAAAHAGPQQSESGNSVVYTFYSSPIGLRGELMGFLEKVEKYPYADLSLSKLSEVPLWGCSDLSIPDSELKPTYGDPVRRYRSLNLDRKELYYISPTIHNSNGGVVLGPSSRQGSNRDICFATCKLMSGQNPATQSEVYLQIVDHDGLKMRTYGGDSGGPVFIRVAHTGDPYKDFELFGICSIPEGDKLKVVPMNNPNVGAWIDSEIIQDALR